MGLTLLWTKGVVIIINLRSYYYSLLLYDQGWSPYRYLPVIMFYHYKCSSPNSASCVWECTQRFWWLFTECWYPACFTLLTKTLGPVSIKIPELCRIPTETATVSIIGTHVMSMYAYRISNRSRMLHRLWFDSSIRTLSHVFLFILEYVSLGNWYRLICFFKKLTRIVYIFQQIMKIKNIRMRFVELL